MPRSDSRAAALAATLAMLAAPGAAVAAGTHGVTHAHFRRESYAQLRKQLDAGDVRGANVYSSRHVVHASLKGGGHASVRYPAADRRSLISALKAAHVRFHVVKTAHAAHHHGLRRRYIALIVAAAVAAVVAAGALLSRRRAQPR